MKESYGEPIGGGWQFNVFRVGNRVCKKPTTHDEIVRRIRRSNWLLNVQPRTLELEAQRVARERDETIAELKRRTFPRRILANLEFVDDMIWQDLAEPLGEKIESDPANAKSLVDRYVEATIESWRSGLAETSFNFTVNHGLVGSGQVAILDLGEVKFDKDVLQRQLESRFWRQSWTIRKDLPSEVASYASRKLDESLTVRRLDEVWHEAPITA